MWVLELIILTYFLYVVSYTAVFSIAGYFYKSNRGKAKNELRKFCVLIPCYKEDVVIQDVAQRALNQEYPNANYTVVVIADSLQSSTLDALKTLPIQVIEVKFETSTKVKALNFALNSLAEHFDYAIILDADNVMKPDFISRLNSTLSKDIIAIQGQRKPKNSNNSLAILDGVSEAINNHIYRQGTVALGLSSAISGSGVAFEFALLKEKLASMTSVGGFDRELELMLIKEGQKVEYLKDAVVFDEKVSQTKSFQNQRKRWISSQYFYLRKYFAQGMKSLLKGDFVFFNSAVLRNIQLPRLLNIGLLTVLTITFYFIQPYLHFGYNVWLFLFSLNTIAILIAIPGEFYNTKLLVSILQLPFIFGNMFMLLFKLRGANKKFIHTPHTYHSIDNSKKSL